MDDLRSLFAKYLNDDCSVAEIAALLQHFNNLEREQDLKEAISAAIFEDEGHHEEEHGLDDRMHRIYQQLKPALTGAKNAEQIIKPIRSYFKYAVAASVLLVASVVIYFYNTHHLRSDLHTARHLGTDVTPGGNKAILTLADGAKISLTDAANGELTRQAGILVTKTKDGQLVYQINHDQNTSGKISYNTISTPAGGQYEVNLPDGTIVWLNALSSLTYTTAFSANQRRVTLTGEAYFEVAKNPEKPFIVNTNGAGRQQEVKVLGTHFNINSYADEPSVKTTLLEGSVQVNAHGDTRIIKPGQQSVLTKTIAVQNVDVNQAVDWKNGNFYLNDESIHSIMRKLSRWYDIEVIYQGKVADTEFGGLISRTKNLSEVLQALETTQNIHFKIQGRRVTVMQ